MKADILKLLLQSHAEGDESSFRKAALQLAAAESTAGHVRVAEEIRAIIAKMPATSTRKVGPVVDIAAPRGELADLLEGGHRDERLRDIVLRPDVRELLLRVISENRSRGRLERFGVSPRRHLLFHGAPGCGKTLAAAVLAGEMGLPLMTVRFDALFSRFLGATAIQLRAIFAEMPRRPGVSDVSGADIAGTPLSLTEMDPPSSRISTSFQRLLGMVIPVAGGTTFVPPGTVTILPNSDFSRVRRCDVNVWSRPAPKISIAELVSADSCIRIRQRLTSSD